MSDAGGLPAANDGGLAAPLRPQPLPPLLKVLLDDAWWGFSGTNCYSTGGISSNAEGTNPPPEPQELLETRWWGSQSSGSGRTGGGSSAGAEQRTPEAVLQERPSSSGWFGWLCWLLGMFGIRHTAPLPAAAERRGGHRIAKSGSFARLNKAEAAGPRLQQPPLLAIPQPQQNGFTSTLQQVAAGQPHLHGEVSSSGRPRPGTKAANYAERRQAWRQRIDAIKAKQASRAATGGLADGAAAAAHAGRVFSKHIAIPIPSVSRAGGSAASTPHGSPARREPVSDTMLASLPQLEAPPIWQGFQTAEAPVDTAGASEAQLQRFLLQAGWAPEAVWSLADHEVLVAAARGSRGAWEVERVIVACVWPEEVLRVPRRCSDAVALRAAFRRVSMAVHPDKCSAVGASDAQSIVSDCYAMLLHAASGGKAAAAVPTYLRQQHAMRASASTTSLTGTIGSVGGGLAGIDRGPAPPAPWQQQQQQQQQEWSSSPPQAALQPDPHTCQSVHISADSITIEGAGPACWNPGYQPLLRPQQQQQQQQHVQHTGRFGIQVPTRASSSSGGRKAWNPQDHLVSEEDLQQAGTEPSLFKRSRRSSTSSMASGAGTGGAAAAAAIGQPAWQLLRCSSSSSLMSSSSRLAPRFLQTVAHAEEAEASSTSLHGAPCGSLPTPHASPLASSMPDAAGGPRWEKIRVRLKLRTERRVK